MEMFIPLTAVLCLLTFTAYYLYKTNRAIKSVYGPVLAQAFDPSQPSPMEIKPSAPVKAGSSLPLDTNVYRGWRTYTLRYDERGIPVLVGYRNVWLKRTYVATCGELSGRDPEKKCAEHLVTLAECSCGIYVLKSKPEMYHLLGEGKILAEVVCYGIVLPYTNGYRATHVRIETLHYFPVTDPVDEMEHSLAALLSTTYGVPCEVRPGQVEDARNIRREEMAILTSAGPRPFQVQGHTYGQGTGQPGPSVPPRRGPSYHALWS